MLFYPVKVEGGVGSCLLNERLIRFIILSFQKKAILYFSSTQFAKRLRGHMGIKRYLRTRKFSTFLSHCKHSHCMYIKNGFNTFFHIILCVHDIGLTFLDVLVCIILQLKRDKFKVLFSEQQGGEGCDEKIVKWNCHVFEYLVRISVIWNVM